MPNPESDFSPKEKDPTMTRRTFLTFVITGAALAGASYATQWIPNIREYLTARRVENTGLSNESKEMISEIVKFRASLGLEGLPSEVSPGLLKKEDWLTKQEDFANHLPEKNKSYGLRIDEVMHILFGSNGRRLVKGAKQDTGWPHGISFDSVSRQCLLAEDVHNIPIENDFTGNVLHEAAGHGSDPSQNLSLPPNILIKTEYGKWMALSQSFSVEGQFLNHPDDFMLPILKTAIGQSIGRALTKNTSITDLIDDGGTGIAKQKITEIAQTRKKRINDIKFNKRVCKEIGEIMIHLLREDQIKFTGSLKKTYSDEMEKACIEIYAEMVRYSLMYPDRIGNNQNIIRGIENVISAIQGKPVNMRVLRSQLKKPSEDVLDRYALEKTFLTQTSSEPSKKQTLTLEQQERARKEGKDFQQRVIAFKNFAEKGQIPDTLQVNSGQIEPVKKFAMLVTAVIKKYPVLQDTFNYLSDESFDPNLHIWEIREIEDAMDTGFIRNLAIGSNVTRETHIQIVRKIAILEKFVNSEAF